MAALSLLLTFCYICMPVDLPMISIAVRDNQTSYEILLKDGETLVSPNQMFELGFFSPGSSNSIRFLGIWYKDLPLTVVWVANRMNPISNGEGRLGLRTSGGLVLLNSSDDMVWVSSPSKNVTHKPILQLLDSGNLVVQDGTNLSDGGCIWQSFDNPTDTLLPGMKLGWDLKAGLAWSIASWFDIGDPSCGKFMFCLESLQAPQLVLQKNMTPQSRWGPWNGQRFSGGDIFKANPVFEPVFHYSSDAAYFTFQMLDQSILLRFVVTPMGNIQFLRWTNHSADWIPMVTLNEDSCDQYAACGPYGICYMDDPGCRCLDGFTANMPEDWGRMDYTGGCKRKFHLNCTNGDGFVRLEGLKLPDNSNFWGHIDSAECAQKCLENCSCMAYATLNTHGNVSACMVWLSDLLDIRNFPHGGDELFVRMARHGIGSMASKHKQKQGITYFFMFLAVCMAFLIGLLARLVFWVTWRNIKRIVECRNNLARYSIGSQESELDFYHFSLETITAATEDFSADRKIGEGGFGAVYEGNLSTQRVAVKRLSERSWQGLPEFKNEISLIARLQHRNLVKLVGYCIQGRERMLVYEYLENKSLDKIIFDEERKRLLPWAKRFNVVKGIMKGLAYLHHDSRLTIIHRDLKASNILLDGEMNPKISDFGLARIFGDDTIVMTRRVIGTYGYMSPEYVMNGQFSTKTDVYSFGVLVLEIVNGHKNWGFRHPDHDFNLVGHTWKLWNEGTPLELADPVLTEEESFSEAEVLKCIQVGLLCVQLQCEDRPTMTSILFMLENGAAALPEPQEPGLWCIVRSPVGIGNPSEEEWSQNGITMTTLCGR